MSALGIAGGSAPPGMQRITARTLGTALASLGHGCSGGCPTAASRLRANAWHLSPSHARHTSRPMRLVLVHFVDASTSSSPMHSVLRRVNRCTWPNRIRVLERHPTMGPLDEALGELGALIRDRYMP